MTAAEFDALAREGYNRIPVVRELTADLDTPLTVWLKLADRPDSYLLESAESAERFGRYSIVGLPARRRIRVRGQTLCIEEDGVETRRWDSDDVLGELKQLQSVWRHPPLALRKTCVCSSFSPL